VDLAGLHGVRVVVQNRFADQLIQNRIVSLLCGGQFILHRFLLSGEQEEVNNLFGGGTGGGLSLTPVGFLVVGNGTIRMVPVSEENSIYDRIIDAVPTAIDKVSEIISSAKGKSNVVVDHEPAAPDSYVPDDESDDYVAGSFEG